MLVTRRRFKLATIINNDFIGSYTLANNAIADGVFTGSGFVSSDFQIYDGTKYNGNLYELFPRNGTDVYDDNVFLKTKHASRDMEVTYVSCNGYLLLRAGTEGAVLFNISSDVVEISRCSMAPGQSQFFLNHYNQIFFEQNTTTIAGWTNTVGDETGTWTVGCKGLDLYIKRNGVEIIHVQDFDVVNPGIFAITNARGQYGVQFRGPITVTHFNRVTLYSDTDNNIIDLRDFTDFRQDATTKGSMDISDPYKLNIVSATALKVKVGDYLSVAVGGEAPFHGRSGTTKGIIGVGGGYPILWTDDETTLQAATDWPYETPIALRSTGEIWRSYAPPGESGQCFRTLYSQQFGQQMFDYNNYLIGYARGHDLRAKVVAISGNQLTLDRPCEVSTTNADVWIDHYTFFHYLGEGYGGGNVTHGKIFKMPAGDIYCSGPISFDLRPNFGLIGAGRDLTRFITPKGCAFAYIQVTTASDNFILKDLSVIGNYVESKENNDTDWWATSHYDPSTTTYSAYHNNGGVGQAGIHMGNMSNGLIQNVLVQNFHNGCLHMQQAHDSVCKDSFVDLWGDPKIYAAWVVGMDDGSSNCIMENITFESVFRLPAFEFFGGSNNVFRNCTVHNGMISSNSGENALILNNTFHLDADVLPHWQVPNNPLCNINGNNGRNVNSPAQVIGNSWYIHGADSHGNQTTCIVVQAGRDGCLIKGNHIEYLDIPASDAQNKNAIGIGTDSVDITIEDNTIIVPEAAWFVEGYPSNGCEININEGVSTGTTIRRNTCHIIGAPIDNPTVCNIVTTGADANNVDIIYWNYEAKWRKP